MKTAFSCKPAKNYIETSLIIQKTEFMEVLCFEYLASLSKDKTLSGDEYKLISYLYGVSNERNLVPTFFIRSSAIKESLNLSRPTLSKYLDSLSLFGILSFKSYKGRRGGLLITLSYLDRLHKQISDDESSFERISTGLSGKKIRGFKLPINNEPIQWIEEFVKNIELLRLHNKISLETQEKNDKPSLQNGAENVKPASQLPDTIVKQLYNMDAKIVKNLYHSLLLIVKQINHLPTNGKAALHFKTDNSKISLQFNSPLSANEINELTELSKAELRQIRGFFSRANIYIYNNNYIYIFAVLDRLFFGGNLSRVIEMSLDKNKRNDEAQELNGVPFSFDEESHVSFISQMLQRRTEVVYGDLWTFQDAYKEWIEFKKGQGKIVTIDEAKLDFKMLSESSNPIESILESKRRGYKSIFIINNQGFNNINKGNEEEGNPGFNIVHIEDD